MKNVAGKFVVLMLVGLFTLGSAQETTAPQNSDGMSMGQGRMNGGMDPGMMDPGMMGETQGMTAMMGMMQTCANMMQMMQGKQMGGMGMGEMDMNSSTSGAGFSQNNAEALARAYLAGGTPNVEAVIESATLTAANYTVQYRQGDTSGTLTVDATTGEVQPQTSNP